MLEVFFKSNNTSMLKTSKILDSIQIFILLSLSQIFSPSFPVVMIYVIYTQRQGSNDFLSNSITWLTNIWVCTIEHIVSFEL